MRVAAPTMALLLATTLPAAAQSPLGYSQAYEHAKADEASLQGDGSGRLLEAQSRLVQSAIAACATPAADLAWFVVVAELDAGGRVVRTWREGATPLAICFEQHTARATLFVPPRAPFYTFVEMSFTP